MCTTRACRLGTPFENACEISSNKQCNDHTVVRCLTIRMSKITEQKRETISTSSFAFPKQRKEPLHDAAHVRNAIARFNQVEDVTDKERDEAWERIKHAASEFHVEVNESSWRELAHSGKLKK